MNGRGIRATIHAGPFFRLLHLDPHNAIVVLWRKILFVEKTIFFWYIYNYYFIYYNLLFGCWGDHSNKNDFGFCLPITKQVEPLELMRNERKGSDESENGSSHARRITGRGREALSFSGKFRNTGLQVPAVNPFINATLKPSPYESFKASCPSKQF